MPRGPRLDAPGTLHHVMVRGIERRAIFRDDADRADFVGRLAALAERGALQIYAWVLLPNHAHLLVRTGIRPLARSMRSLLTGYAGAFNRRHRRAGHLFQNRYKSIVVEEDPYFLELVRYLHLNPLRAGVVPDLQALDRYPWSGHAALVGTLSYPWQATTEVLGHFAPTARRARTAYRSFAAAGAAQGRRPELQGGGLVRSLGGWVAVRNLRRGREQYLSDERVLGSTEFVAQVCEEAEAQQRHRPRAPSLERLVTAVCRHVGIPPPVLQAGSRRRDVARARDGIAYLWLEVWGQSGRAIAEALGVRPQSIYRAAQKGRKERHEWEGITIR